MLGAMFSGVLRVIVESGKMRGQRLGLTQGVARARRTPADCADNRIWSSRGMRHGQEFGLGPHYGIA
jgi:hypothetical protein